MAPVPPTRDSGSYVVSAGAVVTRKDKADKREVLLVHRPKYDDWSFPKGKQDDGEHVTATAVREVLEETGVEIRLGRPLRPQLYAVSGGRQKKVHYWVGHVLGDDDVSGYEVNDEIDDVGWFRLARGEAAADLPRRHRPARAVPRATVRAPLRCSSYATPGRSSAASGTVRTPCARSTTSGRRRRSR